jgi:hypothetical protein
MLALEDKRRYRKIEAKCFAIISFAYTDAPTPLTASAQSMTVG